VIFKKPENSGIWRWWLRK